MLKVTHNINKLGLDTNRQIYECSTCGNLFNWNSESSWYGSYKQWEEQPDEIKYYCSDKCVPNCLIRQKRAGKNKLWSSCTGFD